MAYSIPCLASGVIISRGGRTPLTVLLRANISSPLATYLVCICIVLMKIYLYCCLLIVVGEGLQPNNRVDKRDRIKELKLWSIKAYCCCCSTRGATVHEGEKSLSCIASRLLQLPQYTRWNSRRDGAIVYKETILAYCGTQPERPMSTSEARSFSSSVVLLLRHHIRQAAVEMGKLQLFYCGAAVDKQLADVNCLLSSSNS